MCPDTIISPQHGRIARFDLENIQGIAINDYRKRGADTVLTA